MIPLNTAAVLVVAASAGAISGCSDQRSQLSPASPSSLSSPSRSMPGASMNAAVRRIDSDGDGYDDGDSQMPSEPAPAPDQTMPIPAPVQLTINIVGAFGAGAFVPNPLQAAAGNTIVWTNSDVIAHAIVLDDGTPIGSLAPGQTSNVVTMTLPIMGYHCLLHPSMVGQVTTVPPDQAIPVDPAEGPAPDPGTAPAPPADPGSPYGDYGDDYYYLRVTP